MRDNGCCLSSFIGQFLPEAQNPHKAGKKKTRCAYGDECFVSVRAWRESGSHDAARAAGMMNYEKRLHFLEFLCVYFCVFTVFSMGELCSTWFLHRSKSGCSTVYKLCTFPWPPRSFPPTGADIPPKRSGTRRQEQVCRLSLCYVEISKQSPKRQQFHPKQNFLTAEQEARNTTVAAWRHRE